MRGWGKGNNSDDAAGGMGGGQGRRGEELVNVKASKTLCESFCGRLASLFHVAMFKSYAPYVKKVVGTKSSTLPNLTPNPTNYQTPHLVTQRPFPARLTHRLWSRN